MAKAKELKRLVIQQAYLPLNTQTPKHLNTHLWSVVVEGDSIAAVVPEPKLSVQGAQVLDLEGKPLLPAFIDAHMHLMPLALKAKLDLSDTKSIPEAIQRVRHAAEQVRLGHRSLVIGHCLVGYNWDESKWADKRYLTRHDLDAFVPDVPVVLKRVCTHLWTLNTKAMQLAKLPKEHPGVQKDERGEPTGIVLESAQPFVQPFIEPTKAQRKEALKEAMQIALRHGVTMVMDFSPDLELYEELMRDGEMAIRVVCGVPPKIFWQLKDDPPTYELIQHHLQVRTLKLFLDGSLGAHTAALRLPYADQPHRAGTLEHDSKGLEILLRAAHEAGWQMCMHAIGDAAIDVAIEAYRFVINDQPSAISHQLSAIRHRIEHAEMLLPSHLGWMKRLNLIASMQPNFVGQWQHRQSMYERRLGWERTERMNPFRSVLKKGVALAFGSDGMPFGPLYGIASAMTHPHPEERLSFIEAALAYTKGSALACGVENSLGEIAVGKVADLIVLSDDPTGLAPEEITALSVERVLLGGQVVL